MSALFTPAVARLAARVVRRRYHLKNHARCGAPRNAPCLFYPLRSPPHVRCRLHPPSSSKGSLNPRATDDASAVPSAPVYDPELLLANPCGYLVTARSSAGGENRTHTHRAVDEARYLLLSAKEKPSTLGERSLDDSLPEGYQAVLPLHPKGDLGCAFLPLRISDDARETPYPVGNPVVALGVSALDTFAGDPLPPSNTPEYLSRLLPIERICDAREDAIVRTFREILPQSVEGTAARGLLPESRKRTAEDPYAEPVSFAVQYEHHGKTAVDRKRLIDALGELMPSPDFRVDLDDPDKALVVHVYHDVALCAVLPRWRDLSGYNPRSAAERRTLESQPEREPVQTTGGEGYP